VLFDSPGKIGARRGSISLDERNGHHLLVAIGVLVVVEIRVRVFGIGMFMGGTISSRSSSAGTKTMSWAHPFLTFRLS